MTALNFKLSRDLLHMRGQVSAVTLVVACGIATYVTMRAAYQSLLEVQQAYYSGYRLADVFAHVQRAPESRKSAIAEIPGVAAVETRIVMDVTLDVPGLTEPATGRLVSIPAERGPVLNRLFLREGRYPEAGGRGDVVVSEAFAEANRLGIGSTLSAIINGKWEQLQVVGKGLSPEFVYEVRPAEVLPDNRRFGVLWVGRDYLGPAFNMDGAFNDVALALSPGANELEVIARLDPILDPYGNIGAYGRADQISARIVTDHVEEIRTSGMILPAIFLGIVAFLLHVLMSRLVGTQRAQIAVIRAFGYTRWEIGWHYLKLALVTVVGGTALGVAMGYWFGSSLTALFARYFRFPSLELHVDLRVHLAAIGVSSVAACLGALSAVQRAAALAPAEAMRPEPPSRFQAGFMERTGLSKLLSPGLRMIVRNLERRPLRAVLSALAISLAVAILVIAWFRIDAITQLAAIQFENVQREDITVVFHESRSGSAAHNLARMPGVLRVEPFRQVPVRIRYGHRKRRTAILGLANDTELRRALDLELRRVELPAHGLLLNSALARLLGLRRGDTVTVEVLEGTRAVVEIPVANLIDEPIGLGAYMEVSGLHRLVREQDAVSGAYLSVDPAQSESLYSLLKNTPTVSGVVVRAAMVESYWKNIGESIGSTTYTLVGFACVIAFGIVYNNARIALSERGNELASLRVLGFTRFEIGRILLGEQALLTCLAIPAGLLIGYAVAWLVSETHHPDLLRLPFVISTHTYALAAGAIAIAAFFSGLVVARRLQQMDLTAVLKSRE